MSSGTATYNYASPKSPTSLRHPSHSRPDNGGPRRSMFRGKMGKRLSESIGGGIETEDNQELEAGKKRASFLRKRKGTNDSETIHHDLKNRISSPFDFQHLTHTDRHQAAALEQTPRAALVTGWAERAAQLSTSGSQGGYSPRNISTENFMPSEPRSASTSYYNSPPQSPHQENWQQSELRTGSSPSRPGLRLTRSVESFSQPGANLRAHRHSSTLTAPPRTSSLVQAISIPNIPEEGSLHRPSIISPGGRSKRQSGIWDTFPLPVGTSDQLAGIDEHIASVGSALTTPDDSAIQAMSPPFSPSLADVAEEPERFVSPRPAPQPPRLRSPTSPKSPFLESFSFNSQRSSGPRNRARGNSRASPKSSNLRNSVIRPDSQTSETLGSPSFTRESPIQRSTATRRKSNTWRAIEESWEEDVDYIYEHALEAECDNDWDCVSEDEGFANPHHALARAIYEGRPSAAEPSQASQNPTIGKPAFQLQLPFSSRTPLNNDSLPDLSSTASASTTGTGLQTPFHESEGFILSPSLLLPQDYKEAAEPSYEDILKEYDGSDCRFPITDLDESGANSTRSSRARFSRRSSYDSSLMSSALSSGLWSSPVRRSASSAGSVPELVHSRRARRNFSLVVDELSEQVADLETFGSDAEEEDDDATPPGPARPSAERSFFTPLSDNQSYQRNKHSHKQALSDGAAQLLASVANTKPRARAATTSRTDEEGYLHLFPTPPSFSPPITN
ncbi:hypothetical protein E8E13_002479 [Curvularia kusanoi]|uniref:CRIB domain-containing protein n=1 Tax=Curvularia kusanoi TaxID=90978 RepID=A0A9P4TAL4_CURKU|nr:hypothetical protein E8E13_002479 [Curvularia kusanoi]